MQTSILNADTYKHAATENPDSFIEWIVDRYYFIFKDDEVNSNICLHL